MADWVPLGDRAIRFPRPAAAPRAIVQAVRAWPGVIDVVVARREVAAYFDRPPLVDPDWLRALASLPEDRAPARDVELGARYDGLDLDEVARATGLSTGEVVRLHGSATYVSRRWGSPRASRT